MTAPGRRKITKEQWDLLVESYRRRPQNHSAAARHAGVFHGTAQKAWNEGLQAFKDLGPIRAIIEDEHLYARAKLHEEREAAKKTELEVKAKSREFAVDMHAKEAKLAGGNVNNALIATGAAGTVLSAAFKAAPWITKQLEACAKEGDDITLCKHCGRPFPPGQVLGWMERATRMAGFVVGFALQAAELYRLHVGEPGKILGIQEVHNLDPAAIKAQLLQAVANCDAVLAMPAKPSELPKAVIH